MKVASLEVVRNLVADLDDVRVAEHTRGRVLLGRHAVDLDDRLEHPLGVQPLLVRHNYPPRPFRAAVHFEGRHSAIGLTARAAEQKSAGKRLSLRDLKAPKRARVSFGLLPLF